MAGADIASGTAMGSPGQDMSILIGDTIYFDARPSSAVGIELHAFDTSNQSLWLVEDIYVGSSNTNGLPGRYAHTLIGDTLYFSANDGLTGSEMWAHQPAEIASLSSGSGSGSGSGSSSTSSFVYANNKVEGGWSHACAILDNGDLKCWGRDEFGQLGDGGSNTDINAPSSTAIDLGTGRTAVAVDAGDSHTCAILDNGDLKCWGYDFNGQLGDGGSNTDTNAPSSTAINLGSGRTAVAVSAGGQHTCAILDNGDLKCWGRDNNGQLGDGGSNANTNAPSSTAINLGTGRTAVAVVAGQEHTCVILDNGDLKCWGRNGNGQLGYGNWVSTNAPSSTAINLGTGRTAVAVVAGFYHTCAILDNGDMKCWGRDNNGALGDGVGNTDINTPSSTAIDLGTGRTAVALSAGWDHTCAILDNGSLKCWGSDASGQLGNGAATSGIWLAAPSTTPIDLGTGRTAVMVSADNSATCAVLDNGDLKCWGYDAYGQLGDGGSNTNQISPVSVSGNNTWDSSTGLSSGSGGGMTNVAGATCNISPSLPTGLSIDSNTCTISGTPTVETSNTTYTVTAVMSGVTYQTSVWLTSSYLELTPSVEGADLYLDTPMTDITFHYNASTASGSGSGSGTGSSTSSAFAYVNNKVSGGQKFTCAIVDNGDLKCWGADGAGQLGDGGTIGVGVNTDTNAPSSTAIDLGTGRTAVAVSAGSYHACAILDNGELKCWGDDWKGQLGDGGSNLAISAPSSTAIDLGTGRTAIAVDAGGRHTCAILDNGDMICWGWDSKGQLGDGGSNSERNSPSNSTTINLGTGRTAVAVSTGAEYTCAILDNGELKCWGHDQYGQLGNGGPLADTDAPSTTAINLGTSLGTSRTAVAVVAGEYHACAILDNGEMKCWGRDNAGQLGDGVSKHEHPRSLHDDRPRHGPNGCCGVCRVGPHLCYP